MEFFKEKMKKIYLTSLVSSVIICVLGIFLLIKPELVIDLVSTTIGLIILIPGIISLVDYFKMQNTANLVVGVIACILAFVFIFNSQFISSILPFILGIYFIVDGISKLQYAVMLRREQVQNYMPALVSSILILVCGILLIINPFGGALAITKVIGIFMIIYSVLGIYNVTMIRKEVKSAVKMLEK